MAARAETRRVQLTHAAIEKIVPPDTGRLYIFDKAVPSLAICTTERGARTFYLSRRIGGQPKRIRLGRYPEMSVAQARKAAAKENGAIASGKDPHSERQVRRRGGTLQNIFDEFIKEPTRRKQPKSPKTVADYRAQWDRHLQPWASHKLSQITPAAVDKLHSDIGEHAPIQANRVLALLGVLFEFAIKGGAQVVNPTRPVERYPEPPRERVIQSCEMSDFLEAIKAEPDQRMQDFFMMLLYTGARKTCTMEARWDEIDLDHQTWTPLVKGGKRQTIPLVNQAVALLKRRQRGADGSEWCFPSLSQTGHLKEPRPAWARIIHAAKLSDVRIHDLRRTLGSWMTDLGTSEVVSGAVLGHSSGSVTAIYTRPSEGVRRQAMQTAVNAMLATRGKR